MERKALVYWTGGVVIALACAAVVVSLLARDKPATRPSVHLLRPTAEAVRYKHPLNIADAIDIEPPTIVALEDRIEKYKSTFDANELADLYYRRAQLSGDRGDYAKAEAMAQRSLAILASPNPAVVTLAKLANARHAFREAIELAKRQLAVKPNATAHVVIATAHLALGELDAAMAAAHAAIRLRPDVSGYTTRALVLQARGRDAEAAMDFERAVAVEEPGDRYGSARLRALWARFLIRRGEIVGARAVITEALRIEKQLPIAIAMRGELAFRTGRASDAIADFETAFAKSRQVRYLIDESHARELAGQKEFATKLRDQIETIIRAELETDFGHRLDLVEVLVDRGTPAALDEAVRLARVEVAARPSYEVRYQLARALFRQGHHDEARTVVQEALDNGAHEVGIYELAAQVEARLGHAERARLFTLAADELDPAEPTGWRTIGVTR